MNKKQQLIQEYQILCAQLGEIGVQIYEMQRDQKDKYSRLVKLRREFAKLPQEVNLPKSPEVSDAGSNQASEPVGTN